MNVTKPEDEPGDEYVDIYPFFIEKVPATHVYIWQIVAKNTITEIFQVTRHFININSVQICEQTKYIYIFCPIL